MMIDNDNSTEFNYLGPAHENLTYLHSNITAEGSSAEYPACIRIAFTTVYALLLTIGTAGNILVAIVVWKTKELRNSTHLFLVNLSLANLMVLLVGVPPGLLELHSMPDGWIFGEIICKVVPYVLLTAIHGSVLTILAMSFECYYAICKPLKANYICTQMRASAIWLVAAIFTMPVLFTVHYDLEKQLNPGEPVPVCYHSVQRLWQKLYYLSEIGVFYALPLIILLAVYRHIARHVMVESQAPLSFREETQIRATKQVVLMLSAVVVSFFVCLLPFRVITIRLILSRPEDIISVDTYYSLPYFCSLLVYMNAALSPILYNAISSEFRNSFIRLLRCSNMRSRLTNHIGHQYLQYRYNQRKRQERNLIFPPAHQQTVESHSQQQFPLECWSKPENV